MAPRRHHYTISFKLKAIREIDEARRNNVTITAACKGFRITPKMYRDWKSKEQELSSFPKKKKTMSAGRTPSISEECEDMLVEFTYENRQIGNHVSYSALQYVLETEDNAFATKSTNAKNLVLRRFAKRNGLTYRSATHKSQRLPHEVHEEAVEFVAEMAP